MLTVVIESDTTDFPNVLDLVLASQLDFNFKLGFSDFPQLIITR